MATNGRAIANQIAKDLKIQVQIIDQQIEKFQSLKKYMSNEISQVELMIKKKRFK
jgi:hypothetical protein